MPQSIAPTPNDSPRERNAVPDLRALEAFVTVCEVGSMAVAAQRLRISQSAVSQLVKRLESHYGATLFDRDVRPARPTRAGQMLVEISADLLAQARLVSDRMRQGVQQDYGAIRLGCVDSFAATVGPALVRALAGSARQLQLWSGLTPALSGQLHGRELDMVICTDTPITDPRITRRPIFTEQWVAVFPSGFAGGPITSLAELKAMTAELPLIRYSQRSVIGQQIERFVRHAGMQPERRYELDATDPMLSLVAAGLGWAISSPLCLWQSRAWLSEVRVVALPRSRLGSREFFLMCRDAEWERLADEVVRLARSVLRQHTVPAMLASMPTLTADVVEMPA
ncbi:LysR family transcriptional regulator [soil metagenome]